ncbi:MAG: DUF2203 domain-containing protein [Pedosphaera parvula]|nr:DUF2203 domain-containing protein [Verrucomicrobiota bacterium]MBI3192204.1 DUF2203 domain-containing protein [Pedosphaera parvula]
MPHLFKKHYTREEARALLPQIRRWLKGIADRRDQLRKFDEQFAERLILGEDLGGGPINRWVQTLAEVRELLLEFGRREIQIKDLDRGLIDFPAIIGGKEAFLCWEQDEEDIEYWHDLESGYAGRERL